MAPLALPNSKPLFLKPSLSPWPPQNPNPNFAPISLLSSPVSLSIRSPPSVSPIRCSGTNDGNFEQKAVTYTRPEVIAWSQDLTNSVQLIGNVGKPVEMKRLPNGSVVAWTSLGVYRSSNETTWVNLIFWKELAYVAYQHVETGQQIFVSGKLVSDEIEKNEKTRYYFKVVVKQLNFVQNSIPPVSFNDPRMAQNSPVRCSGTNDGNFEQEAVTYPKPEVVAWSQDLANTVQLIGYVEKPVEIKRLASGNVVAWTILGIYKSSNETAWVNVTFWNELAHVAYQHVEIGKQIFVSGKLVSVEIKEKEKTRQYFKVVVKQLNFFQHNKPASFFDPRMAQTSPASVEKRWKAFFANPHDWWDNRRNKKYNLKAPDFKHKVTGEGLWIISKFIPPWVISRLKILDSKMD